MLVKYFFNPSAAAKATRTYSFRMEERIKALVSEFGHTVIMSSIPELGSIDIDIKKKSQVGAQ